MKVTLKIAKAELNTLFYSPIAWLLIIVFLFQCGLTYTAVLQNYLTMQDLGGPYLMLLKMMTNKVFAPPTGMFSTVIQKIYLYIPLLTMGLISREISSGTIKLLYSSPIKISQIVFGKFLAMVGYNFLLILIVFCFVISGMFNIHAADLGLMLSSLLGIFLLLCAYSAIGLFMSSLTSYQIVAAMSTLVVFAALQFIGTVWQDIDFVRDLTYFLSISGRTGRMLSGLISTKDVIYFFLIIYIFLGSCIARLQFERESKAGIIVAGKYAFIFFSALAVGYITSLTPLVGYYDASAGKQMTLTANSQKIIAELGDEPLEVTSYINLLDGNFWQGKPDQRNIDLNRWQPYLRFKSNIKLKYIYYYDLPIVNRQMMTGRGMPKKKEEDIKVTAEKYAKPFKVDLADFKTPEEIRKIIDLRPELNRYVMQLKFKGKTTFLRLFDDSQQFPSETETDAALKRLVSKLPKIAFLEGEFERSKDKLGDREYGMLTSMITFRNSLVNQGFDVENVSLQTGEIPSDVAALVIADPKTNFTQDVLAKIQKYIDGGGNLLIAGEPGKQSILNPLLGTLGVQIMDGILVQNDINNPPDLLKPLFTTNITNINKGLKKQLRDSIGVSMPGVAGLTYITSGPFLIKPLLMTDENLNWNKKGKLVVDSADVVFSAANGDTKTPVPTVLALTRQINHKEQRIIVAGDADFLTNRELGRSRSANYIFGLDIFGWFSNGQFPIDTSRPESEDTRLNIGDGGVNVLKVLFLGLFPGLLAIIAAVFLIRRKRK